MRNQNSARISHVYWFKPKAQLLPVMCKLYSCDRVLHIVKLLDSFNKKDKPCVPRDTVEFVAERRTVVRMTVGLLRRRGCTTGRSPSTTSAARPTRRCSTACESHTALFQSVHISSRPNIPRAKPRRDFYCMHKSFFTFLQVNGQFECLGLPDSSPTPPPPLPKTSKHSFE